MKQLQEDGFYNIITSVEDDESWGILDNVTIKTSKCFGGTARKNYLSVKIKRFNVHKHHFDDVIEIADAEDEGSYSMVSFLLGKDNREFAQTMTQIEDMDEVKQVLYIDRVELNGNFQEEYVSFCLHNIFNEMTKLLEPEDSILASHALGTFFKNEEEMKEEDIIEIFRGIGLNIIKDENRNSIMAAGSGNNIKFSIEEEVSLNNNNKNKLKR